MHVVCASLCPLFTQMSTQLYNHYRIVEENSVKWQQMATLAFRFCHIQSRPRTPWSAGEGDTPSPYTTSLATVPHHFSKLSAEIEVSRSPICHSVYSRQHCNDLIDYRLLNMFAQTRCDVDKPGRRPAMTLRTCGCPQLSSASRNSWNC